MYAPVCAIGNPFVQVYNRAELSLSTARRGRACPCGRGPASEETGPHDPGSPGPPGPRRVGLGAAERSSVVHVSPRSKLESSESVAAIESKDETKGRPKRCILTHDFNFF